MHYLAYNTMPTGIHNPAPLHVPSDYNAAAYFIDRHIAEGRGAKAAFVDDAGSHSYAQVADLVNRTAAALLRHGIRAGDRVILCLLDTIAFPAMFFGALKIGAVPVPINTYLTADDYDFILRDSAAVAVALSAPISGAWVNALHASHDLQTVVVAEGAASLPVKSISFAEFTALKSNNIQARLAGDGEVGFWQYSSGSTGRPKGVMHRQSDLFHAAVLYGERVLGVREDDTVFSASKLFFAYGLGNACVFPLHAGATAILMSARSTPETVVRTMRTHQPTIFYGVPTLYASMLAFLGDDHKALSQRLRVCTSAGEALPPAVADHWAGRVGIEILDGLGSTESAHIFISNRPGKIRRGSSGQPVAGYEVSIRKDDGSEAATDQIGDLWLRGVPIAVGYWNNPEANARTFVNGWMRTGDKYSRDADGFYYYAGRSDDMLKVGGIWVSPIEVEAALVEHPQVLEAAVIGFEDADALVKPKAFVVLRDRSQKSKELTDEITQFVRGRLAHYKCPRVIEFIDELPRTATGKLRRNVLRSNG